MPAVVYTTLLGELNKRQFPVTQDQLSSILAGVNVITSASLAATLATYAPLTEVWTNAVNAKTTAYTLAPADASETIALGGSAFYTLTASAPSVYPSNYFAVVTNTDTGAGKVVAASGVSNFILWPLQTVILFNVNGAWDLSPETQRWQTTGTATFHVDPNLGSDANDGLAAGAGRALKTIQKAITVLLSQVDTRGNSAFVQLADGAYTDFNVSLFALDNGPLVDVGIGGASGHGASVLWNVPAGQVGIQVKDWGCLTLSEMVLSGGASSICVLLQQDGIVDTEPTLTFGNCPSGAHITVGQGGSLNLNGHSISGTSYGFHIFASSICSVAFNSAAISLAAATFVDFILAWAGACVNAETVTFTGAGAGAGSTGTKFVFQYGATLLTNGRNPNTVFPGTTNGVIQLGNADGAISAIPSLNYSSATVAPGMGMLTVILDSPVSAAGATITAGGGSNVVLAWYNNSGQWKVVDN